MKTIIQTCHRVDRSSIGLIHDSVLGRNGPAWRIRAVHWCQCHDLLRDSNSQNHVDPQRRQHGISLFAVSFFFLVLNLTNKIPKLWSPNKFGPNGYYPQSPFISVHQFSITFSFFDHFFYFDFVLVDHKINFWCLT